MLCMMLLPEEKRREICFEQEVDGRAKVYHCPAAGFDNYIFFTLRDYCLKIHKIITDPNDPFLFDFMVKGVLGYGEQHMALDVEFARELDDVLLQRFGFLKDPKERRIRLWKLGGGCSGCGSKHKKTDRQKG